MIWHLYCRLHGELAATVVRDSAAAVQQELLQCYALIERLGRGVVYYGSARLKAASPHWDRARQLGAQVAALLGCTTWSGGGPGMMEAATLGAPPQSTAHRPFTGFTSSTCGRRC
jgi:predicted Rossmann-fold nucleotide-binding protein